MKRSERAGCHCRNASINHPGQSLVEFALILPLFVLFIIGVFELGRAFFAYIAISNAAREGARIYTFWPDKTTLANIEATVNNEIGTNSVVDLIILKALKFNVEIH